MAMTAFELFGVLKLDKKDFEAGMRDAERDTDSFSKKVDDAGKKTSGFSSLVGGAASGIAKGMGVVAKVSGIALGAATTAATGFAKSSMDAAVSYESAFTGVRKTVDATEEEYSALSDWIMEASTKMASSKEDIAATMEIAGQLGVEGVEGLESFTETMIMLGDTTNLNAEEAASALAKFGNIAGLQPTDMDRIGSAIVDLGNHFATTEADITAMATRLASAGTIAGLSATDILGLSTAMSSVGIQAEAGGTAMAQTMASMTKAVEGALPYLSQPYETLDDDAKEAMESLYQYADVSGMTAQEFAGAWKGEPIKAIQAFIGGLGEMNEADESVVMMLDEMGLKGIRQSNMLQALALASDTMTDAVDTANTAYEENVALQNEANTRYATTESQALQTAEAFKNLKVTIGEELMPTYQKFLGFSSTAMQDISAGLKEGGLEGMMSAVGTALSDGLNQVIEMIPVAIDAGSQLLEALGKGILDNLPTIAKAAVDIVVQLSTGLVNALPQLAEGVVTLVQSLGNEIANNSEALLSAGTSLLEMLFNGIVTNLPSAITGLTDLIIGIAEWISSPDTLTPIIEGAVAIILALADGLIQALPALIEAIPVIIQNLVTAIVDNLPMLVDAAVQLLGALAQAIIENLPLLIAAAVPIVFALANGLIQALPALVTAVMSLLFEVTRTIIASLPTFIENGIKIVGALIEGIVNMLGSIVQAAIGIIDQFLSGLKNGLIRVTSAGAEIIDYVRNGIASKIEEAAQWGRDLIDNFISGITEKASALWDTVSDIADGIKGLLGFSEPEIGPLSNFHTYAPDMMNLFAQGIKDNKGMLLDTVSDAFDFGNLITAPDIKTGETASDNHVIINVYGAQGQDEEEIARIVANKLRDQVVSIGATA